MAALPTATFLLLHLLPPTTAAAQESVYCPITYQECTNGLFSPAKCACECIPPYCPDANGACLNPTGYCGGNPWIDCERGVDCPWWVNPLKAESCATGSAVPAGTWEIFANLEYCCMANFPYSTVCKATMGPPTGPPTKAPSSAPIAAPAAAPTDAPAAEVEYAEIVPLELTLLGVSNVGDIRAFKDEMLQEMKSILTQAASDADARLTAVSENYNFASARSLLTEARDFSKRGTRPVKLYYDAAFVRSTRRQAPALIAAVKSRRDDVLEGIRGTADGYYYPSNFDLCAAASTGTPASPKDFDLCVRDREIVRVKFSAENLVEDLDREEFEEVLLGIYYEVLTDIDGLEVIDVELGGVDRNSYGIDVYFDADVIKNGQDWEKIIEVELEKEATKRQILEGVKGYTSAVDTLGSDGEAAEWCLVGGKFSMDCVVVQNEKFALPLWAVIAIAAAAGTIVCCLLISCCICARQKAHEEDVMKENFRTYVADEERWRAGQYEERRKRMAPKRRWGRRHRPRQPPPGRPEKERRRRSPPRGSERCRSRSPRRREDRRRGERKIRHRDGRGAYDEEAPLALPPPQYALPPPQYEESCQPRLLPLPPPTQFARPPPREELMALEGPIYCDDAEVNRPDPPMNPGPVLMLTDGRQPVDRGSDESGDEGPMLAIEPEGRDWDDSGSEESYELEWEESTRGGGASSRRNGGGLRRNGR